MAEQALPESQAIFPFISGTITFTCCGVQNTVRRNKIEFATCSVCHTRYGINLVRMRPCVGTIPPRTAVRFTSEFIFPIINHNINILPGTKTQTAHDPHQFIDCPPGHTLLEIPCKFNNQLIPLVAPVPDSAFEVINE